MQDPIDPVEEEKQLRQLKEKYRGQFHVYIEEQGLNPAQYFQEQQAALERGGLSPINLLNQRSLVAAQLEDCLTDQLHRNLDLISKVQKYKLFFDKVEAKQATLKANS